MTDKKYGTELDAVIGSELRDTQGEVLDVRGADISDLEAGKGYWNDNHSNKLPDVLGRITGAKKIFGPEDCDNDRHRYYWNKIKAPLIYASGYLFDSEGEHRSAKAAAAILRHTSSDENPLKLKASVEGGILERGEKDSRHLKRTKIKGAALCFTPANNATLVEGLSLVKSAITSAERELIQEFVPFAVDDIPNFFQSQEELLRSSIQDKVVKINSLTKMLVSKKKKH